MSSIFNTDADEAIKMTIDELCTKLRRIHPAHADYATIITHIATLRASLNAPISDTK